MRYKLKTMKAQVNNMKPQDIVLLLKIISLGNENWNQKPISDSLKMSQSEISASVSRSKYSGLLEPKGKKVMKLALIDFLQFGIKYVFPQQPGPIVRGIPTSHSAPPLVTEIQSSEQYVWPSVKGKVRGQSIIPLYSSVTEAIENDDKLYELLALVDALRVGRARERELAINILKSRILDGK